ncbi:MAG: hypothetical protein OEV42_14655 [Deltaproteobacteria bacterium]|nr:hypothetical protein [Deltaproteobacteria bacterium]
MTAQELTALVNLLALFKSYPMILAMIIFFVLPWVVVFFSSRNGLKMAAIHDQRSIEMVASIKESFTKVERANKERFEEVLSMYEKNVELVKDYEKVAGDLVSVIQLNTQVSTKLAERIKKNGT